MFPAPSTVSVIGVDCISSELAHWAEPLAMLPHSCFEPVAFMESAKTKVLDKVAAPHLQLVRLGPELYGLVFFAAHDGAQIGFVQADNAVRSRFFGLVVMVALLLQNTSNLLDTLQYRWLDLADDLFAKVQDRLQLPQKFCQQVQ